MRLASIRTLFAATLLAAVTSAQAHDPRSLPLPELQRLFLACERQASSTLMSAGEAAACSSAYEALLKRGFDGDFSRLVAWWRSERAAALSAGAPMP